jgi:hypothetical protein
LRLDVVANRGCDRLGDGVGLLSGQTALLDREACGITRREDSVEAGEAAVAVGVDEPVASGGDAAQPGADQPRLCDDAVDGQAPRPGGDSQPSGAAGDALAARVQRNARVVQKAADCGAGGVAEDPKWLFFGGTSVPGRGS